MIFRCSSLNNLAVTDRGDSTQGHSVSINDGFVTRGHGGVPRATHGWAIVLPLSDASVVPNVPKVQQDVQEEIRCESGYLVGSAGLEPATSCL